jgi:hypothetical protein
MSKRLMRVIVVLALCGLTIGVAVAGAQSSTTEFDATMAGSKETPKGPSRAKGTFKVEFRGNQACYTMSTTGLGDKPIAAHIHKGSASVKSGPIVIDLKPSFKGTSPRVSKKCVAAKAAIVAAIKKNPSGYYANVHTKKNPAGAARGQLRTHQ